MENRYHSAICLLIGAIDFLLPRSDNYPEDAPVIRCAQRGAGMPQVDATEGRAGGRQAGAQRDGRHGSSRLRCSPRALCISLNARDVLSSGLITPPTTPFWKQVVATALSETREALRLDSAVRILTGVGAPAAAFLIVARTTGQPAWAGLVAVGLVLLLGIVVFIAKILSLPPKMFGALKATMAEAAWELDEAELDFRAELVDRLAAYYVTSDRAANARIHAGLALPPPGWMNGQLLEMGECWHIHDVRGTRYRISELRTPAPQKKEG